MDFSDKLNDLLELGSEILGKLYYQKMALTASRRPACLSSLDYQKIRAKFAKSFPTPLTDMEKTPGWDVYQAEAATLSSHLSSFRETYSSLAAFAIRSVDLLRSIPGLLTDLKISKNRTLLINYLELISLYVKTIWLFASVEELKMVVSFTEYTAFYALSGSSRTNSSEFGKTAKLLGDAENLHLHLVSTFGELYPFIQSCLLQLGDSVALGMDIDRQRDEFTLFPANDISNIYKAANEVLSETNATSRYNELQDFDRYRDVVILSFLACPYLFFDAEAIELFTLSAKSKHFIRILRDVSINFHIEFEVLSYFFPASENTISGMLGMSQKYTPPSTGVVPVPPKGFKLKTFLKETCKKATADAGNTQRERRFFLCEILRQWNATLEAYPGILGPRLPQILAATSLAKTEILEWFRQEKCFKSASNGFRKDCKKFFVQESYGGGADVSVLMGELSSLITKLTATPSSDILFTYYRDYVLGIDRDVIAPLCEQLSDQLPHLKGYFDSFVSCIDSLSKINSTSGENYKNIAKLAETYRWNWLTCSSVLASKNMAPMLKAFKNMNVFFSRMQTTLNHFLYLDSFTLLMGLYAAPTDIYWFRDELVMSFQATLSLSSTTTTAHSFAYIKLLHQTVAYNFTAKNKFELTLIEEKMINTTDSLVSKLDSYLISLVKSFWDNFFALENQGSPFEAGRRIEKMSRAKNNSNGAADDAAPLPGFESEAWARSTIDKVVRIRCQISDLVSSCLETGSFNIGGKAYNTLSTVVTSLERFLEDNLLLIFSTFGSELNPVIWNQPINLSTLSHIQLARPSTILVRLKTLIHTVQIPLSLAKIDVTATIRRLMFHKCFDLSIPVPGSMPQAAVIDSAPTGSSQAADSAVSSSMDQNASITTKVTNWVLSITKLLISKGQDIVWMPHLKAFCKLPSKAGKSNFSLFNSSSDGARSLYESENYQLPSQFSVFSETFLNHKELTSLITVVGVQVIRHVDEALLKLAVERIETIKVFIINNQDALTRVIHNVASVESVLLTIKDGLSSVFNCLLQLGVIFCVRDLLHTSLGECVSELSSLHELTSTVDRIIVSPFAQTESQSTFQSLAYDFGNLNSNNIDRALKSALRNTFCNVNDNYTLTLLPVVCSLVFLAEDWKKSQYNSIFDVFSDNEHCIHIAIWKLHSSFFGREKFDDVVLSFPLQSPPPSTSDKNENTKGEIANAKDDKKTDKADNKPQLERGSLTGTGGVAPPPPPPPPPKKAGADSGGGTASSTATASPRPPPPPLVRSGSLQGGSSNTDKSDQAISSNYTGKMVKITINSSPTEIAKFDFDEHMGCFISLCSQFLLFFKALPFDSNKSAALYPIEPLIILLDSFVFTNRKMTSRSALDSHIPFALIHQAAMNSSIGKSRQVDQADLSLVYTESGFAGKMRKNQFDEDDEAEVRAAPGS